MLQRVQSLFLLASVILQVVFISAPLAHYVLADSANIDFYCNGFFTHAGIIKITVLSTAALYILAWVNLFLSSTAIFLFKKRKLQIRLCLYTLLLTVGLIVLSGIYLIRFKSANEVQLVSYSLYLLIPLVNILLLYLAVRGIKKDELIVKSYDRLR
jgi:hypothetical protein